jgi:hypothetical protein
MTKRKHCLSVQQFNRRMERRYTAIEDEIKSLRIPFMRDVSLVAGNAENIFINVLLTWWSLLFLGLVEVYTKLRIYYYRDDSNPIAARCYVRIVRKKRL